MRRNIRRYIFKWVGGLVIGAIVIAIIGRVWGTIILRPHKIYLIGNIEDNVIGDIRTISLPDPHIIRERDSQIAIGFIERERENQKPLRINGIKVEIVTRTDKGDPLKAEDISRKLMKAEDTLLVIGHMSSTQTEKAITKYLQAEPPIPTILTKETNPNLIPPHVLRNLYRPVFRLSATDERQVDVAVNYVTSRMGQEEPVFWVAEGTINPTYSNYLALELIKRVQEEGRPVLLYTNIKSIPSVETFRTLGINCILFAGSSDHALILVRQIRALTTNNANPLIILNDACVNQRLIDQGGQDVEGLYLTYPLSAKQLYDNECYKWYGKVAYEIVEGLVRCADRRFYSIIREERGLLAEWFRRLMGAHPVEDARLVINSIMEEVTRGHGIPCEEGRYYFNEDGILRTATFHVLQIRNGRFCDIEANTTQLSENHGSIK